MLLSQLTGICKQKGKLFETGKLFAIEENMNQTSDFFTVSWMVNQLSNGNKVTFIAFRQNYAHFLNISKKLGKSIEQFLKSKQLMYIECFQNLYCSELPLTETSPNSYVSPPTSIRKLKTNQILKQQNLITQKGSTVIIDSISFVEPQNQIIFKIYEQAMQKNCKLILGGAMEDSQMVNIFKGQSDLHIKLQNDVGNHGRFKIFGNGFEINLLWKYQLGKFEITQYMKL